MNLYFIKTLELHDILKSFSLFFSVKNILKLNMEHSVKFKVIKWKNLGFFYMYLIFGFVDRMKTLTCFLKWSATPLLVSQMCFWSVCYMM